MVEVHAVESILWDTTWELTQHNMASDDLNEEKDQSMKASHDVPLTLWKNNLLVSIVMAD